MRGCLDIGTRGEPPHPDRIWRCDPASPRKRGEAKSPRGKLSSPTPRLQSLYFTPRRPICSMQSCIRISTSRKEHHMSFYDATVPAFLQILGTLSGFLGKAEAHCQAKNIQPEVLLSARLYPDMFPLTRQIQTACDFAAKGCARLTGSEVPSTPDTEKSFADLQARSRRPSTM